MHSSSKALLKAALFFGGSYCFYSISRDFPSFKSSFINDFWASKIIEAELLKNDNKNETFETIEEKLKKIGQFDPNLPMYTMEEVIKHNSKETGIWVTYLNGVYDITSFVDVHPGGYDKIRLAFGGAIDPFWNIYGQHKVEHVLSLLEEHRIGNLSHQDAQAVKQSLGNDAYANDPLRHPALKERSKKPYNAETPNEFLGDGSFYTPNQMFYVRNHLSVPLVNPETYRLRVSGKGLQPREFTLDELKALFPKKKVVTTIQCAGNRRDEMNKNTDKKVSGLVWDIGAIGNAEWSGAPLKDILSYCGFKNPEEVDVEHVWFEGLDTGAENNHYGASIPIDKAIDEKGDVIIAYEMNGEEIPRDHGYPIRVVCPGIVGARNVKWLGEIITSEKESPSHWQQKDYKGFGPNIPLDKIDWDSSPSIQELPIQSAISYPTDGQKIDPYSQDKLNITGYAYSGGGKKIVRVDVSLDGGKTWTQATLKEKPIVEKRNQAWSWTLWELPVDIPETDEIEIVVKAVDSNYNVQPETSAPIWNARGVLSNAWHRVKVQIDRNDDDESV